MIWIISVTSEIWDVMKIDSISMNIDSNKWFLDKDSFESARIWFESTTLQTTHGDECFESFLPFIKLIRINHLIG